MSPLAASVVINFWAVEVFSQSSGALSAKPRAVGSSQASEEVSPSMVVLVFQAIEVLYPSSVVYRRPSYWAGWCGRWAGRCPCLS